MSRQTVPCEAPEPPPFASKFGRHQDMWGRMLERLRPGESFLAPVLTPAQVAVRLARFNHGGIRFEVQAEAGGTRVWRVEDAA